MEQTKSKISIQQKLHLQQENTDNKTRVSMSTLRINNHALSLHKQHHPNRQRKGF